MDLLGISIASLILIPPLLLIDVLNKTKTSFVVTFLSIAIVGYFSITGVRVAGEQKGVEFQWTLIVEKVKSDFDRLSSQKPRT